ncbi:MAG: hypothetical protein Q8S84_08535 [bacterium]|nr:hypothetical protein [bacterium]
MDKGGLFSFILYTILLSSIHLRISVITSLSFHFTSQLLVTITCSSHFHATSTTSHLLAINNAV